MIIGIDGSRAFLHQRTGIEEYSYQVIKGLVAEIPADVAVRLYVPKKKVPVVIDFALPKNWEVQELFAPRLWTKFRLSLEMLIHPVDTLLVPAHTLPLIGAKKNVVVIHGLEYELCPEAYSFWERLYMRLSIKHSCAQADALIAVSENTKQDLITLYGAPQEKIKVVYEGFVPLKTLASEFSEGQKPKTKNSIVFIGRIEERKNVARIVRAFEILKEKYTIPHTLVLAGKPGVGYEKIQSGIEHSVWKENIQGLGYVSLAEKQELLVGASVFVFPSLYEGFGLPILEAQAAGVPVVTSNVSSLPEVAGQGAVYVDPQSPEDIAEKLYVTLTLSEAMRADIVAKGYANLKRFSWEKCAAELWRAMI